MTIKLPREEKQVLIEQVQQFFREEREEEIGELGASFLLDFMITELSPYLYNQALQDARTLLAQRTQALEDDLYALEKRPRTNRSAHSTSS